MNVFTNVWKNPYTYATKKGEICHKIQLSKKTDKKKKQNEVVCYHLFPYF